MNKLFTTVAALSLLTAFAGGAQAQDQQGRGDQPDRAARPAGAEGRPAAEKRAPEARPQAAPEKRAAETSTVNTRSTTAERTNRTGATNAHVNHTTTTVTHRTTTVTSLQRNVTATRHYQIGAYRAPPGYVYRQWGYGQRLPGGYYAANYWIGNFLAYGLIAPPSGLVWVRVGNDALLINQANGEVVQAQYGLFA